MQEKPFDLQGKSAVITGGASGIGQAISQLFARQGAHILILDANESAAREECEAIRQAGGKAEYLGCDVSNAEEVQRAFASLPGTGLDILVNNAGIAHVGTIEQTTIDDLDRIYQVNIKGVFNCLRAGVERMKSGGGSIINMASIASLVGIPERFAYSMSKGAVLTMTYSVAQDYLQEKIRCNCIAPARIHTPFVDGFITRNYPGREQEMFEALSKTQPIGRMGTPEEVAYLALFLASDQSSFITGTCYPVDGGFVTLN